MISELKELLNMWIAAVAAAIEAVAARLLPGRRVLLTEFEPGNFTARLLAVHKGPNLPPASFRFVAGQPEPALTEGWRSALRGSRIDIMMRPDHVLFRALDFPRQATDFLHGMVRSQIDRLTPWVASEAMFGMSAPVAAANERIALTLAATAKRRVEPLLEFAADCGAASVSGLVEAPEAERLAEPIKLFEKALAGAGGGINLDRLLRLALLGLGLAAAASLAVCSYASGRLAAEQAELQQKMTERRAALRVNRSTDAIETLLAGRKQNSPSAVLALEAITRALPDTSYATELRIESDKIQVIGLTRDAPPLIRLIEQSPQFSRAIFFAPTTRDENEPGERFHIEAHIKPYFGSGS